MEAAAGETNVVTIVNSAHTEGHKMRFFQGEERSRVDQAAVIESWPENRVT